MQVKNIVENTKEIFLKEHIFFHMKFPVRFVL